MWYAKGKYSYLRCLSLPFQSYSRQCSSRGHQRANFKKLGEEEEIKWEGKGPEHADKDVAWGDPRSSSFCWKESVQNKNPSTCFRIYQPPKTNPTRRSGKKPKTSNNQPLQVHCDFTGNYRFLMIDDFKHVVMKEMQVGSALVWFWTRLTFEVTNSYKERAEVELSVKGSDQSENDDQVHSTAYCQHFPVQLQEYKEYNPCFYQFV